MSIEAMFWNFYEVAEFASVSDIEGKTLGLLAILLGRVDKTGFHFSIGTLWSLLEQNVLYLFLDIEQKDCSLLSKIIR